MIIVNAQYKLCQKQSPYRIVIILNSNRLIITHTTKCKWKGVVSVLCVCLCIRTFSGKLVRSSKELFASKIICKLISHPAIRKVF